MVRLFLALWNKCVLAKLARLKAISFFSWTSVIKLGIQSLKKKILQ